MRYTALRSILLGNFLCFISVINNGIQEVQAVETDLRRSQILIPSAEDGGGVKQELVTLPNGYQEKNERFPVAEVDFERIKVPFIIGLWILTASLAKIGFHMTPKLSEVFPESCLLVVIGLVIGIGVLYGMHIMISPLTPTTFFFYMLPPVILDAGYFMPNRIFFDNLGTILLMAVVGTTFNFLAIGTSLWACGLTGIFGDAIATPNFLETFLFASVISAVDPVAVLAVFEELHVDLTLHVIVFGESLLNDAVTIVWYHMMEVYNSMGLQNIMTEDIVSGIISFFVVAIGGTLIGVIWGFLTGLVTRVTHHVSIIEPVFVFVMAYLAYLNAEMFHMSGILSATFCGLTMKNYVEANVSQTSKTAIRSTLKTLSNSSEIIVFLFLGVATITSTHDWNTAFVLLAVFFCTIFRIIGVIILSAFINRYRMKKLDKIDQIIMSYGGLRGAVAFALVLLIDERVVPHKNMFLTTTLVVIYFNVFIQGITIRPLIKWLNVKRDSERTLNMNERVQERCMDHVMAGVEDIVGRNGNFNLRDRVRRFNNRFINPILLRDCSNSEHKFLETYSNVALADALSAIKSATHLSSQSNSHAVQMNAFVNQAFTES